jgi:hypothetical protein
MLDNGNEKDWFNPDVIIAAAVVSITSLAFLILFGRAWRPSLRGASHRARSLRRTLINIIETV